MSDAALHDDEIVRRIRAGRERWIELDAGNSVKIRRPAEAAWPALRSDGLDAYLRCVVDWRGPGFTVGAILGAGDDTKPLPFSAAVWLEVAHDQVAWCAKVAEEVAADVKAYAEKKAAASGN